MNRFLSILIIILALFINSNIEIKAADFIWQETFDTEVFSTSDLSIVKSPSGIITTKDKIYILDKGTLTLQQKLKRDQFAIASKDGQSYAIVTFRKGLPDLAEKITFYTQFNQVLSEVKIDGYPILSPKGNWFITISRYNNQIKFYSQNGELLKNFQFKNLSGVTLDFSENNKFVIINIPQNETASLVLFNSSGKQIFSWDHKDNLANVSISKDASKIAFASEKQLILFNKQGKVIWQKEITLGGNNVAISEDGSTIALSKRINTSVTTYDHKGNQIWRQVVEGFQGLNSPITALDVNSKGKLLLGISYSFAEENDKSYLIFLNKKGKVSSKQKYKVKQVNARFINPKQVILTAEKNIFVYKLD